MSDKKLSILQQLHVATAKGEIVWLPTNEASMYIASVGVAHVSVKKERGDYFMHIYGKEGNVVETISDNELLMNNTQEYVKLLRGLWTLAREKATGSGEVMDSILDALKGKS